MVRPFDTDYLIDGKAMLAADNGADVEYTDLESDGTGLDESGVLHRDVMRFDVRSWTFTYSVLTSEEYNYLQSLFRRKTFFDFKIRSGSGTETVKAYCGNSSLSYFSRRYQLHKNLQFTIKEC